MNIHLDLWLIYLINLLPAIHTLLICILVLIIISSVLHLIFYMDVSNDLETLRKKQYPTEKESEDMQDHYRQIKQAYKIGFFLLGMSVFILFINMFIPDKKDAIQLLKVNYINQSNMVLDDNSIDALSQNIDTILNSK